MDEYLVFVSTLGGLQVESPLAFPSLLHLFIANHLAFMYFDATHTLPLRIGNNSAYPFAPAYVAVHHGVWVLFVCTIFEC